MAAIFIFPVEAARKTYRQRVDEAESRGKQEPALWYHICRAKRMDYVAMEQGVFCVCGARSPEREAEE